MTYRVLGRRPAQLDTHQATQMTHQLQLGGAGGVIPPNQRTLLGHSENYGAGDHGIGGTPGQYSSSSGQMQMSMPAYQAGSPYRPYMGARDEPHPMVSNPPTKKKRPGGDSINRPQF